MSVPDEVGVRRIARRSRHRPSAVCSGEESIGVSGQVGDYNGVAARSSRGGTRRSALGDEPGVRRVGTGPRSNRRPRSSPGRAGQARRIRSQNIEPAARRRNAADEHSPGPAEIAATLDKKPCSNRPPRPSPVCRRDPLSGSRRPCRTSAISPPISMPDDPSRQDRRAGTRNEEQPRLSATTAM